MKRIDLHTHSSYSDGTLPPAEVVRRAGKAGVEVLFLTDHDSISGFGEAREAAAGAGVRVYCGIEINTCQSDRVHVLGYAAAWKEEVLAGRLSEFRARREKRAETIVDNLRSHGVDLSFEDVRGTSRQTLGRPHVADALIRKGVVRSRQEAFDRFLAKGKPGYAPSLGPTPEEAIDLIRSAGGFPSLAHPNTVGDFSALAAWKERGLEGMEVHYGSHSPSEVKRFGDIAKHHGLLATGGSDYHGPGTGRDSGLGVEVPDEAYDRFMERLGP